MAGEHDIEPIDETITCWCGAKGTYDELFSDECLDETCGGSRTLHCHCGGHLLCVCHHHGETECRGCRDCDEDDECDDFNDEE